MKNLTNIKIHPLNHNELKKINGDSFKEWFTSGVADVYQYFFCNHNNGYYFDSHPEHTHDY